MKDLAIDIANTDRELEKALGISMEELEANVNGTITTDFAEVYKAVSDGVNVGLGIGKRILENEDPLDNIPRMHTEIAKIMKRFPTLGEKLDNV